MEHDNTLPTCSRLHQGWWLRKILVMMLTLWSIEVCLIPSLQAGYFLSEHFLLYTKGFSDVMILSRNRGHNGARLKLMEQKTLKVSWSYLCTFPTNLQEKFKLFFELGLSLAVSGDTPTVPLVTLVLFVGPLGCSSANLKTSLNVSRSTAAFSIDVCTSCTHMGNIPSSSVTVKPNTAFIQKIHLLLVLNKWNVLLLSVVVAHNLQTLNVVVAIWQLVHHANFITIRHIWNRVIITHCTVRSKFS